MRFLFFRLHLFFYSSPFLMCTISLFPYQLARVARPTLDLCLRLSRLRHRRARRPSRAHEATEEGAGRGRARAQGRLSTRLLQSMTYWHECCRTCANGSLLLSVPQHSACSTPNPHHFCSWCCLMETTEVLMINVQRVETQFVVNDGFHTILSTKLLISLALCDHGWQGDSIRSKFTYMLLLLIINISSYS